MMIVSLFKLRGDYFERGDRINKHPKNQIITNSSCLKAKRRVGQRTPQDQRSHCSKVWLAAELKRGLSSKYQIKA